MLGPSRRHGARIVLAPLAMIVVAVVGALPASASSSPSPSQSSETTPGPAPGSAGNQVVLVGRVVVPQGQSVGEVIVFSGRVLVEGVVRGDVVVLDGPITVSGQVSGSVVALDGSVRLTGTAQVGGDVLAHDRVVVTQGAAVQGRITEDASFNLSRPLRTVATFVSWLAVALSTLVLGLVFAWVAPARARSDRGRRSNGAVGIGGMGRRAGFGAPGRGRARRRRRARHPARGRAAALDTPPLIDRCGGDRSDGGTPAARPGPSHHDRVPRGVGDRDRRSASSRT